MKTKKRAQKEFLELAGRFRDASGAKEAKSLGDALGRMVFGDDATPALNEYHVRLIKKGLRAAEEGDFVSQEGMKKLIATMTASKKESKRSSRTKVRKALKILARAGKKNPPAPGTNCLETQGGTGIPACPELRRACAVYFV